DTRAAADRSSLDFESFHISSNPVSRRASPIPLTSVSSSSIASERDLDTGRSDLAESGYDSRSDVAEPSHLSHIGAFAPFDSAHNIRIIQAPVAQATVILQPSSSGSRSFHSEQHTRRATHADGVVGDGPDVTSSVLPPSFGPGPNDAWGSCVKALRDYDEHMVRGWKEDIDSLLVFSGLFSAVLTAFNIESYKLLQQDPTETSAALLARISAQLAGNSANGPSSPSTSPPTFHVSSRAVRINILWFSSLVLSLVSASIGILTKQWLREYISNTASSHRENARIRQLRHDGFIRWHIPLTIALLPILLQIAMALFFAGLLDLLWSLHPAVAGVVTVLVTISLSFLVFTTLLPTLRGDCPYKSPQAMGVFLTAQAFMRLLSYLARRLYSFLGWDRRQWPIYVETSLFRHRSRIVSGWLRSLVHRKYFGSWREREKAIAREVEAKLDHRILAGADAMFMDDVFLERVVRACISDTEEPAAVDCLHEIIYHRADGMMDGIPHWRHAEDVDGGVALLLHLVADVLPRIDKGEVASIEKTLLIADRLCRAIPFEDFKHRSETIYLYQRLFESLSVFLVHEESIKRASFDLMRSLWGKMEAPVASSVIQSLIKFARLAKQADEVNTFHLACEMALSLSTRPDLPLIVFNKIRDDLQGILEDLEGYLTASDHGTNALGSGQSGYILLALEELAALDPDLISINLVRILDHVRLDGPPKTGLVSDTESLPSHWKRRLASARAVRKLRESRPRWQRPGPQRRNAIHVQGAQDLEALNLRLPKTPEKYKETQTQQQHSASTAPIVEHLSPSSVLHSSPSHRHAALPSRPSTVPEGSEPEHSA
ncbi:hypothetical protein BD309DRAFT_598952, partial [Dichomitus squalens]